MNKKRGTGNETVTTQEAKTSANIKPPLRNNGCNVTSFRWMPIKEVKTREKENEKSHTKHLILTFEGERISYIGLECARRPLL